MKRRMMQKLHELMRAQYEKTIEAHALAWIGNLAKNYQVATRGVDTFTTGDAETCLIFAPGASLTQYESTIASLRSDDVCVVASPTVLPWMMKHGIPPDVVVAVDRHDEMQRWVKQSRWRGPVLMPSYGNPGLARNNSAWFFNVLLGKPGYLPLIDSVTQVQYPTLPCFRSVGHVTGQALQLMIWLTGIGRSKFRRYVLVGADYGYWHGGARVSITGDHESEAINAEASVTLEGVETNYQMAYYKERLLKLWSENPVPLYSCSEGLLVEIPYVGLEQIKAGNYPLPLPSPIIDAAHRKYLLETLPTVLIPALEIRRPSVVARIRARPGLRRPEKTKPAG